MNIQPSSIQHTEKDEAILTDQFGRKHTYLRISLTERCNLRCTYCMPANGVPLTPKENIMSADEVFQIATTFVNLGVTKIRLTGGEPMIRKDFPDILKRLSILPIELAITTNGILLERYQTLLQEANVSAITVSIDSLKKEKFKQITRRDYFDTVWNGIQLLLQQGLQVKLNIVLIKNFNENEIIDFINLTKNQNIVIRFIEFMPFDGNDWNKKQLVSQEEILKQVTEHFETKEIERLKDRPNDTARNFKILGFKGSFAIISSVTNPFCDSCNRIRLTANGKLKNCLFSAIENDLLSTLRMGGDLRQIISKSLQAKYKKRGGMDTLKKLEDPILHSKNRSMITIGG